MFLCYWDSDALKRPRGQELLISSGGFTPGDRAPPPLHPLTPQAHDTKHTLKFCVSGVFFVANFNASQQKLRYNCGSRWQLIICLYHSTNTSAPGKFLLNLPECLMKFSVIKALESFSIQSISRDKSLLMNRIIFCCRQV